MTSSGEAPDPPPQRALVSACLLGRACRYDGRHNRDDELGRRLASAGLEAFPFCPEEAGGLGTPRPPAWIDQEGAEAVLDERARVVTESGADVTAQFLAGARGALAACREHGIQRAFLKERSPSCGVANTHVQGDVTPGPGVTTALLRRAGIEVEGVEGTASELLRTPDPHRLHPRKERRRLDPE